MTPMKLSPKLIRRINSSSDDDSAKKKKKTKESSGKDKNGGKTSRWGKNSSGLFSSDNSFD
jgi:hypothetical protein